MPLPMNAQAPGTHVEWPIGRRGEGVFDVHPGRINSIGPGYDDQGRFGLVAEVVTLVVAREENGGAPYTRIRKILERFLRPRSPQTNTAFVDQDALKAFDEVAIEALYEQAANAGLEYLMAQAQPLDAVAAGITATDGDAPTTDALDI